VEIEDGPVAASAGNLVDAMHRNAQLNAEERERGATRLESTPLDVILELTTRCNLKCVTCGRMTSVDNTSLQFYLKRNVKLLLGRHTQANVVADMPPEMIRGIFETIGPGAMVLELNGVGESPMTRSWQLVLDSLELSSGHPFLTSNGTALDERTMRYFIEREGTIRISLDAASAEVFYRVRGVKVYEHILKNVRKLMALRREMNRPGFSLEMAFVAFADNLDELMDFVELAHTFEADYVGVLDMFAFSPEMDAKHLRHIPARANEVLIACRRRAAELGIRNDFPCLLPGGETSISEADYEALGLGPPNPSIDIGGYATTGAVACHQPWTTTMVHEDGDVVPCCRADAIMGNLQRDSFEAIWNGPAYVKLRQDMLGYARGGPAPRACRGCSVLEGGPEPGPLRRATIDRKAPGLACGTSDAVR
jgi:MoaA/NifB/PqqE/SkfB family radical SAM enzyme